MPRQSPKPKKGGQKANAANASNAQPKPQPPSAVTLAQQYKQGAQKQSYGSNPENNTPDYTANNNPELLKLQQKLASGDYNAIAGHLKNISQQTDLNNYNNEGRAFHDFPYQKFLLRNNLTDKPTFMNSKDFNTYIQQSGQSIMYRGWSGKDSASMLKANLPHTGNGVIGDGWYFSPNKSTAKSYGNYVTQMALSPTARVAKVQTIRQQWNKLPTKLQVSLSRAGSEGTRSYGTNVGEAQLALAMGYNVIKNGNFYVALTRDALVVKDFK